MALDGDFEDVLVAAQAGGEWAIARLYRDLNPALLRFLTARAGDAGEDLAQETWMGVARSLPSFSGDERAFRSFVFTIAHRRLVQRWRDLERRPSIPVPPEDLTERGDGSTEPGEALSAAEAAAELVAGLPADQAEIILLRVVAGLDAAEVGEIVGKSAVAVRVMQHRALKRLAERISDPAVTR